VCCDILAHGCVWATAAAMPGLRQKPGPTPGEPLPTSFLKQADEQTVVGLASVLQAIQTHGLSSAVFTDWAVLAAPRFLGRVTLASALQRFAAEGAWGVSPHLIPHRSLHSMSGTVSQALRIHGPNFGVGGGPGGVLETLLCAGAILDGHKVPGVWVVLTGWDPEPVPDDKNASPECHCVGLCLALVGARPGWRGGKLRLFLASEGRCASNGPVRSAVPDLRSLEALLTARTTPDMQSATAVWQLEGGGRVELAWPESGVDEPQPAFGYRLPAHSQADGRQPLADSRSGAENPR
jgi:hypothetical protein